MIEIITIDKIQKYGLPPMLDNLPASFARGSRYDQVRMAEGWQMSIREVTEVSYANERENKVYTLKDTREITPATFFPQDHKWTLFGSVESYIRFMRELDRRAETGLSESSYKAAVAAIDQVFMDIYRPLFKIRMKLHPESIKREFDMRIRNAPLEDMIMDIKKRTACY